MQNCESLSSKNVRSASSLSDIFDLTAEQLQYISKSVLLRSSVRLLRSLSVGQASGAYKGGFGDSTVPSMCKTL